MSDQGWIVLLVGLALARSLVLGVLTPPYQSSDEPWHLDYARAVSQGHWPVLGETLMSPPIVEHAASVAAAEGLPLYGIDTPPMSREAYQPPLGYLVPAAGYRVAGGPHGGLIAFRVISALLGAATAAAAFVLGRRAFPAHPGAGPFAGLLAVLLPAVAAIASRANNDPLLLLLAMVTVAGAATAVRSGASPRLFAALGVAVAAAGWAKASGLLIGVPVVVAALLAPVAWRERWKAAVIAATAGTLVIAPWMVRNLLVYGEPFGTSRFRTAFVAHPGSGLGGARLLLWGQPSHPDAERFWPELGRSTIGLLGWSDVALPMWAYVLAGVAAATAVMLVVHWLRGAVPEDRRAAAVLLSALPPFVAGVTWFAMTIDYQPQGRYVMPAVLAAGPVVGAALGRRGVVVGVAVLTALFGSAVAASVSAYGWT